MIDTLINICSGMYIALFIYIFSFFENICLINKSNIHGIMYCCSKLGNCQFLIEGYYCSKYKDDLVMYKLSLNICNIHNRVNYG